MDEPVYDGRVAPLWGGEGGGLYFRSHGPLPAGAVHNGHRHQQDHWTLVLSGSVRVRYRSASAGDVEQSAVFIAPYKFVVAADVYHEIESLQDGTVWSCMFVVPAERDTRAVAYHAERPEDPTEAFDG
jgi:tellurite resistance-related uncharacterized protein